MPEFDPNNPGGEFEPGGGFPPFKNASVPSAQEQRERAARWLAQKWTAKYKRCPICESNNWQVSEVAELRTGTRRRCRGNPSIGGSGVSGFYAHLHNLRLLSYVQRGARWRSGAIRLPRADVSRGRDAKRDHRVSDAEEHGQPLAVETREVRILKADASAHEEMQVPRREWHRIGAAVLSIKDAVPARAKDSTTWAITFLGLSIGFFAGLIPASIAPLHPTPGSLRFTYALVSFSGLALLSVSYLVAKRANYL